jgi:endonuclease/exonuclease/phosphatase family metal-dependent hydrolase
VVLAQSAALWWPGELASHWTLHAALVLASLTVLLRGDGWWPRLSMLGVALAVWPWLLAAYEPRAPGVSAGKRLSVVSANLLYFSASRDRQIADLAALEADVTVLVEVVHGDQQRLARDARWPYQAWNIPELAGVAVLSRLPLVSALSHQWSRCPAIEAVVEFAGAPLRILAVHPKSPVQPRLARERDESLRAIAALVAASPVPTVVLGDFNLTVGSPVWRAFRAESGLRRAEGHACATWPSPLGPFGIGIDHILVSAGLGLETPRALWLVGSDHLAVAATLSVLASAPAIAP